MRVCLSMIVRNEAHIIHRLLSSVVGFADEYCICDTGSTDETIYVIETFEALKGRIYTEPFVNFEVSRTNALREAQKSGADYILLLDADMVFKFDPNVDKSLFTLPVYTIYQESGDGLRYSNVRMVRGDATQCKYIGVTHEYFDTAGLAVGDIVEGLVIRDVGDGGSKSDKFERDIRLLTKGVEDEPNNVRYRFYLANSYFDTQRFETAIKHYTIRVQQGDWDEEVYYSLYRISLCYKGLNKEDEFLTAAIQAWRYRPIRAESIYDAMQHFHKKGEHKLVVFLYSCIKDLGVPNDKLFVSTHVYTHQMHLVHTLSAFFAGVKSCPHFEKLFNSPHIDLNNQFNNYRFYYPVPCGTSVDFSASHFLDGQEFVASSPSIVALSDSKYLMNVRLVNYKINPQGGYDMKGTTIATKNKMLILNKGLEVVGSPVFPVTSMEENGMEGSHFKYSGVEDIKLAQIQGKILYTGTMCLHTKQIGTCIGVYDEQKLEPTELSPMQACEKNWVFLPNQLSMVYQWYPLMFGPLVNGKLELKEKRAMPKLFELARGSTNGVEYNDEWWFVVHYVYHHANELRFYLHSIVVFDKEMNLKRYTLPFKFTRPSSIEYCLGIVVEKERILLSHSIMDREAYVRAYSFAAFDWVQA
jgi:glycosyltransferase involved in cell wall biosynthesis